MKDLLTQLVRQTNFENLRVAIDSIKYGRKFNPNLDKELIDHFISQANFRLSQSKVTSEDMISKLIQSVKDLIRNPESSRLTFIASLERQYASRGELTINQINALERMLLELQAYNKRISAIHGLHPQDRVESIPIRNPAFHEMTVSERKLNAPSLKSQ